MGGGCGLGCSLDLQYGVACTRRSGVTVDPVSRIHKVNFLIPLVDFVSLADLHQRSYISNRLSDVGYVQ